jgi:endonuclease/exonuclease/phosphatase family metal-dependent hydrolase
MRLLVRTWNLFHGRSVPETRQTHVDEMAALVTADDPDLVCLQEVPVSALAGLDQSSGMVVVGAVAMPAVGGRLGRRITGLDPKRFRSALTGQANAVLVSRRLAVAGASTSLVLNPRDVRQREARREGLPLSARIAWARNRRIAQLVRVAVAGRSVVVANVHLSSLADSRPAEAELLRAATYAEGFADPAEPMLFVGDLNLTVASSTALRTLVEWGFSEPVDSIDQILVRGLTVVRGPEAWPDERRRRGDVLLSDHAPVEAEMIGP